MASQTKRPRSLAEEIDKAFLSCGICLERFDDPRALPCLHAFCCDCLEKLCRGLGKNLFCPTCRSRTTIPNMGVRGFPPHFLVTYLKDTVDKHNEPPTKAVMPLNIEAQKFCLRHEGEMIRYFCETCNMTICPDCIILDSGHKGHTYIRLKELAQIQADSLKSLVDLCKDVETKYQNCIEGTNLVEKSLEQSAQLAYDALDKIKNAYVSHLDFILTSQQIRLQRQETSRSVVICQTRDDLQMSLTELQSACQLASKVAEAGTEFEVVSIYASLSTTLQKIVLLHPFPIDPILGEIKLRGASEQASMAMEMVAKGHDIDGNLVSKRIESTPKSQKRNFLPIVPYGSNTLLQYILVAVFAILMYRVLEGIIH